MTIQEMKDTIRNSNREHHGIQQYSVKYTDGSEKTMRLFVSTWDMIAQVAKGKRNKGYHISTADIESICLTPPVPRQQKTKWEMGEKTRKRAIAMLEKSRLNPHYLKEIRELGEITETTYNDFKTDKLPHQKICLLETFLYHPEKAIKTIDWTTRGLPNDERRTRIQDYIRNNTPFDKGWEGRSYDISISIEHHMKLNQTIAYYAEEYRGTGNGHYYLLLDENHAIHVEDD